MHFSPTCCKYKMVYIVNQIKKGNFLLKNDFIHTSKPKG